MADRCQFDRGCQRIGVGEVFLMNRRSKDSLDGWYFGTTIIGRVDPLWIRKEQ